MTDNPLQDAKREMEENLGHIVLLLGCKLITSCTWSLLNCWLKDREGSAGEGGRRYKTLDSNYPVVEVVLALGHHVL